MSKSALLLLFSSISCSSLSGDSGLDGSNYQEIVDYEAQNGNISVRPNYRGLGLRDVENKKRVLKVGIFITYDGTVKADGSKSADDTGTLAYNDLKKWFAKTADQGGLLEPDLDSNNDGVPDQLKDIQDQAMVDNNPALREFRVKGYGRDLWKVSDEVYWNVSVTLGHISHVHRRFGKSIAENDITMINGHFYQDEVENQQNNANFMQRFFGGGGSKGVYPEAMETFAQSYNPRANPYKILVVNGCKSELIEDLVINTVKKLNSGKPSEQQLKIDIVGQRGFSNFNFFGPQITSFILGLTKSSDPNNRTPTDWKQLISALTFNKVADPKTIQADPSMNKVEPVLRRYPPQLKATASDGKKGSQL